MKIALINENSQAAKNSIIFDALTSVVEPMGHKVFNYGMYTANDEAQLTYVQVGLLTSILLTTKAADFVVTGCGTGEGAMLAANSFPNVSCGLVADPTDAFLFGQINDGNAISIPYAKGFGWAAELNLKYIFEKLFEGERGLGYPKERAAIMAKNREILKNIKKISHKDLLSILKEVDQEFLKQTIATEGFKKYFFENAEPSEIVDYLKAL